MFNTLIDSSAMLNGTLSFLGGIVLSITVLIIICKKFWENIKNYIVLILILGFFFFGPFFFFFNFLIFVVIPTTLDNYIYFEKPKEYKIQILEKKESVHTETPSSSNKKRINRTPRTYYTYSVYAKKWWDESKDSSEIINFQVSFDQYNKLYEKEYVYVKSYKGVFGYHHLYRDADFLKPAEEEKSKINKPSPKKKTNKSNEDVDLNPESRIVSFEGDAEYKTINNDWKPCSKTTFNERTLIKTKENSKVFVALPFDNSVKIKGNTNVDINPIEKVIKFDMTSLRLDKGELIFSIAPRTRNTLRTIVGNFEIDGNSAIYKIIYSKESKKLEIIVKSGFVTITMFKDNNRMAGIGKSYKMELNEIKETSLKKINPDDYNWD